jgi:predicted ArsR family transcriptional regulator
MSSITSTDRQILEVLVTEGRNNAINVAAILDRNRPYINTRLSVLAREGYVKRVGPAPNSGLYELTSAGREKVDSQKIIQ